MKKLILILILISINCQAQECKNLKVKGRIVEANKVLILKVHQGSQSEIQILIDQKIQTQFLPYINKVILAEGTLEIDSKKLVSLAKIELSHAEPLSIKNNSFFKINESIKCPN
ncbi:MAG: hypothetical protein AB7I27_07495 [Bacteriovoracaceae bacterium]